MTKERLFEILNTVADSTWEEVENSIMSISKSEAMFINTFCDSISMICKKNMMNVD